MSSAALVLLSPKPVVLRYLCPLMQFRVYAVLRITQEHGRRIMSFILICFIRACGDTGVLS